jgi:hypothetical protein
MNAKKVESLLPLPNFVRVFRTKREYMPGMRQLAREKRGIIAWADIAGIPVMVWWQKKSWWVIDQSESAKRAVAALTPQAPPKQKIVGFPYVVLATAEGDIGHFP